MPKGSKGRRKPSRKRKDGEAEQRLICAATQAVIRSILDALLWWITREHFR